MTRTKKSETTWLERTHRHIYNAAISKEARKKTGEVISTVGRAGATALKMAGKITKKSYPGASAALEQLGDHFEIVGDSASCALAGDCKKIGFLTRTAKGAWNLITNHPRVVLGCILICAGIKCYLFTRESVKKESVKEFQAAVQRLADNGTLPTGTILSTQNVSYDPNKAE